MNNSMVKGVGVMKRLDEALEALSYAVAAEKLSEEADAELLSQETRLRRHDRSDKKFAIFGRLIASALSDEIEAKIQRWDGENLELQQSDDGSIRLVEVSK